MDVIVTNRRSSTASGEILADGPSFDEERSFELDPEESQRYKEVILVPDHSVEYEVTVSLEAGASAVERIGVGPGDEGEVRINLSEDRIEFESVFQD